MRALARAPARTGQVGGDRRVERRRRRSRDREARGPAMWLSYCQWSRPAHPTRVARQQVAFRLRDAVPRPRAVLGWTYARHEGQTEGVHEGRPGRRRAVPDRRQQPCLQGVLRAPGVDRDRRRAPDECDLRLRLDDGQDPGRPPPPCGDRCLGRRDVGPRGRVRGLQGAAAAAARPAVGAVAASVAARRGVRLPQRQGRGLGGGRRDRHPRSPGPRGEDPRDGRVRRSGRLPGGHRRGSGDDHVAGRHRDEDLRSRGGGRALRRAAGAGHRPDRAQGRHVRQHPRRSGDRRQDRRPAATGVRLPRVGAGERRQDLRAEAEAEPHRARR